VNHIQKAKAILDGDGCCPDNCSQCPLEQYCNAADILSDKIRIDFVKDYLAKQIRKSLDNKCRIENR
jgi:hypothetical protein